MSAHTVKPAPPSPDFWDPYSDQPYPLPREQKRRFTPAALREYLTTALTALAVSPALLIRYAAPRRLIAEPAVRDFVGLGISPHPPHDDQTEAMVAELDVRRLLVRVPSWEIDRIDEYARFVERFAGRQVLVNVLQHRRDVLQPAQWRRSLETILERLGGFGGEFQIGNAINRTKWGCMHSGEYLRLLEIAEEVRSRHPGIRLTGSSVIDFEPLATLRTLINREPRQPRRAAPVDHRGQLAVAGYPALYAELRSAGDHGGRADAGALSGRLLPHRLAQRPG
jgi:hypothetical protein